MRRRRPLPSAPTTKRPGPRPSLEANTICLPSGDQAGLLSVARVLVICTRPVPSCPTTYRSPLPLRVLANTTRAPSGESAGSKSLAALGARMRGPLPSEPAIAISALPVSQETNTSGTTGRACWPGASGVVNAASSPISLPHAVDPITR